MTWGNRGRLIVALTSCINYTRYSVTDTLSIALRPILRRRCDFDRLIQFYKGEPHSYILRYRSGHLVQHGPGLTFWYIPYHTSIAVVPLGNQDAQFIFNETTQTFQPVSIQGCLTYRVVDPVAAAQRLDFTIDPATQRYKGKDLEKLQQRLINAVQAQVRTGVNALSLEAALTQVKDLGAQVLMAVNAEPALRELGITVESVHITQVNPTPEMRKALEADYREALQQRADQAIYARRGKAVEEERKIRQGEMNTEVELEERRKALVDTQARNSVALAEAAAKAEELKLSPYNQLAPQVLVGLALKEWAGHGQIDQLTISPDLLSQLVGWVTTRKA